MIPVSCRDDKHTCVPTPEIWTCSSWLYHQDKTRSPLPSLSGTYTKPHWSAQLNFIHMKHRESQGFRMIDFWKTSYECRLEQCYQNLFCFLLLPLLCIFSYLYSVLFLFVSVPPSCLICTPVFNLYPLLCLDSSCFCPSLKYLIFNYSNCSLSTTTPSLLITC